MKTESIFSKEMKRLMKLTNMKNATVAAVLGYDVSYVSKWVNGRNLPSAKTIGCIIEKLSKYIDETIDWQQKKQLCSMYEDEECSDFAALLYKQLYSAYKADKQEDRTGMLSLGSRMKCYSMYPVDQLIDDVNDSLISNSESICLLDLFGLSSEYKLQFLRIKNGYFFPNSKPEKGTVHLMLDFSNSSQISENNFYGAIYILHLLTRFSKYREVYVYSSIDACGKMVLCSDKKYFSSALLLPGAEKCFSYFVDADPHDYELMHNLLQTSIKHSNLVFTKRSVRELCENNEYNKSFVTAATHCLIGHIPEFLLSFQFVKEYMMENTTDYQNWKTAYNVINKGNNVDMIIYESAISDFMLNGRVDFFGRTIIYPRKERAKIISDLMNVLTISSFRIKLILGGFFEDFVHLPNPCMLLSDLACYFRVDNADGFENVFSIVNPDVKRIYSDLYHFLWNGRKDVIIDDRIEIYNRIDTIIKAYMSDGTLWEAQTAR